MAQTSPTLRRRRLARRLRQMREQAGLTLEEAAPRLDKTRSSLGRIETGKSRADVHLIRSMMDLYDIYDPDLLDLARAANRPGWWKRYKIEDRGYFGLETEAASVHEFTLVNIPGLLQTEEYMRAQFVATGERLENAVGARLFRQRRIVDEESPLELVALIDEAALRRNVGGREVMRAQLRYLAERALLPTVTIQVLLNGVRGHVGSDGAFTLLSFPEGDPSLLYGEYATGALHIEAPDEVEQARRLFEGLSGEALSPAMSVEHIQRLADEL